MSCVFYLENYSFIWISKDQILVYNSLSGEKILFQNNETLKKLTERILEEESFYSVALSKTDLKDKQIKKFITQTRKIFAGDIINLSQYEQMPVIMPPLINFQKDKIKVNQGDFQYLGDKLLEDLYEINICTCSKSSDSVLLKKSFNQEKFTHNNDIMPVEDLIMFISKLPPSQMTCINIFLYDSSRINYFNTLLKKLSTGFKIHLVFTSSIFISLRNKLSTKPFFISSARIQISPNDSIELIHEIMNTYHLLCKELKWIIPFTSDGEFEAAQQIIAKANIDNYYLLPVFNENNLSFFKKSVFIDTVEIKDIFLKKRQIFTNQTLNSNDFGKLIITHNGNVHANLYHNSLGTINDNIKDLIYKEIDQGTSWRRIRDMEPCCDCVYQWLCPSPSNYELAIGKPNLCHMKP